MSYAFAAPLGAGPRPKNVREDGRPIYFIYFIYRCGFYPLLLECAALTALELLCLVRCSFGRGTPGRQYGVVRPPAIQN